MHLFAKGKFSLAQLTTFQPARSAAFQGREFLTESARRAKCARDYELSKAHYKLQPPTELSDAHAKIIETATTATRVTPLSEAQCEALQRAMAAKADCIKDIEAWKRCRDKVTDAAPRRMTDSLMVESIAAFDAAQDEKSARAISLATGIYHGE